MCIYIYIHVYSLLISHMQLQRGRPSPQETCCPCSWMSWILDAGSHMNQDPRSRKQDPGSSRMLHRSPPGIGPKSSYGHTWPHGPDSMLPGTRKNRGHAKRGPKILVYYIYIYIYIYMYSAFEYMCTSTHLYLNPICCIKACDA